MQKRKRIYADVCTLCRPFDDQNNMRIRLETDAYYLILQAIRRKLYKLVLSPVHSEEINAIDDFQERHEILTILEKFGERIRCNPVDVRKRAEALYSMKFGIADAAHVAFAEATADYFVSCDDKLVKKCKKNHVHVVALNPTEFCIRENLK